MTITDAFERYAGIVLTKARQYAQGADAEDLCSITWLKAVIAWDRCPQDTPQAFLFLILRNTAIDRSRSRNSHTYSLEAMMEWRDFSGDSAIERLHEVMDARERWHEVEAAFRALPDEAQRLLVRAAVAPKRGHESRSTNRERVMLHRARAKLKEVG